MDVSGGQYIDDYSWLHVSNVVQIGTVLMETY